MSPMFDPRATWNSSATIRTPDVDALAGRMRVCRYIVPCGSGGWPAKVSAGAPMSDRRKFAQQVIVVDTENCDSNSLVVRNCSVTEVGICDSKFSVQGTTVNSVNTAELPLPLVSSSARSGAPSARWLTIVVCGQPLYSKTQGVA